MRTSLPRGTRESQRKPRVLGVAVLASVLAVGLNTAGAQVTRIRLDNPAEGTQLRALGSAVAMDEDVLVVGATATAAGGFSNAGAASVWRKGPSGGYVLDATLSANDPHAGAIFGASVAIDGDTIAVGAPNARTQVHGTPAAGAVYIFTSTGGTWSFRQKLVASDAAQFDKFGGALALDGDTLLVGAVGDDSWGQGAGAAYVLERVGGNWVEQQELHATIPQVGQMFGASLCLEGDVAIIGAPGDDGTGNDTGAAYAFRRVSGVWTQTQRMTPSAAHGDAEFGYSVSISGSSAAIGAKSDVIGGTTVGTVFAFTESGGTWTEQQKFDGGDSQTLDYFGESVLLDGDTLIVGAPLHDTPHGSAGAAYVFARSAGIWGLAQKITATDLSPVIMPREIGRRLALSGDDLIVGMPNQSTLVSGSPGVVGILSRSAGVWGSGEAFDAPRGWASGDHFASGVAASGDTVIVSSPEHINPDGTIGTLYFFDRVGSDWVEQQRVVRPSTLPATHVFGSSAAVSGDTALVLTKDVGDGTITTVGGPVLSYERVGGAWTLQQEITDPDPSDGVVFGGAVALWGDTLLVGTDQVHDGAEEQGVVYAFVRTAGTWTLQQRLLSPDTTGTPDFFGRAVALHGNTAVIGARWSYNGAVNAGAAYVFRRTGSTWDVEAKLNTPTPLIGSLFGGTVAVEGNTVLVGETRSAPTNAGRAYIFERVGSMWSLSHSLQPADPSANDLFGSSVALSGNNAIVVASKAEVGTATDAGAAYLFTRSGTAWTQVEKLVSENPTDVGGFGSAVSVTGGTVVIGAPTEDAPEWESGVAYVFEVPAGGAAGAERTWSMYE